MHEIWQVVIQCFNVDRWTFESMGGCGLFDDGCFNNLLLTEQTVWTQESTPSAGGKLAVDFVSSSNAFFD